MKKSFVLLSLWCLGLWSAVAAQSVNDGKMLLKQGKAKEAVAALQKAVAASARNVEALLWLGQAHLQTGRADSAEVYGRRVLDLEDKNPAGFILVSKAALEQKNRQVALQTLRKGLKANKNNAALLIQLGYFHMATDSADQAIGDFSLAKESDPKSAVAWEGLGDAYANGKPPNNAVAILQYEAAIKIDSVRIEVHKKLSAAYAKERRWNEAARAYATIVKLDTTDQAALFELGMLYNRGSLYPEAANVFRLHTRRFPAVQKGWELYMESRYRSKRNYPEVVTAADQVLKADPKSAKAQRMLAHALYVTEQYGRAITMYKQIAAADTLGFDNMRRWADAYVKTKQDSLAALTYEAVLKIDATKPEVYSEAGTILMRLKKWDRAAEMFEKRYKIDPTAASAFVSYAYCNTQLKRFENARGALRQAITLRPQRLDYHFSLAICLHNMDSLQTTGRMEYETVVKLADTSVVKYKNELVEAHKWIGVTLWIDKKYPQAIESLEKALALKNDDAATHFWKARALAQMLKFDDAIKEYRVALKLDPKNKEAKKELDDLVARQGQ